MDSTIYDRSLAFSDQTMCDFPENEPERKYEDINPHGHPELSKAKPKDRSRAGFLLPCLENDSVYQSSVLMSEVVAIFRLR